MINVIFSLNGKDTIIQCNINEQFKDICKKFVSEKSIDVNKFIFKYEGNKINNELTLEQIKNKDNKEINQINILVEEEKQIKEERIIQKDIFCPICKETINIEIKDYKINLFNCKNGHTINDLCFKEFEKTQNIDISQNICNVCYKNNINNNKLYRCCTCNNNLCLICKVNHNQEHKIVKFDYKNCICYKHDEIYSNYCNQCKENICKICYNEHSDHELINFEEILPNKNTTKKEMLKLSKNINKLNEIIKDIISKLISIIESNEVYYRISNDYIFNYDIKNYQMINNIKEFKNFNAIIMNDFNKIINENIITNKFNYIMDISNKINKKINSEKYSEYMNKKNYKFKSNPNLKFNTYIVKNNDSHGKNDTFEVYLSYKDNKDYFVSPNMKTHNLDIYTLIDNKKIISLKGHKNYITTVKYFFNDRDCNEYLISADHNKIVIIWDITNNYDMKIQIYTKYKKDINSCILSFLCNYGNFIITSTEHSSPYLEKAATKVFSLNSGNFIKYISGSNKTMTYYLLNWHNKKSNKYYVIQFTDKKILISNLLEDEIYSEISNRSEFGYILYENNKEYLCFSSPFEKCINIWDLNDNCMFKIIYLEIGYSFKALPWNNKYIICYDRFDQFFKIIDIINERIISKMKNIEFKELLNIKKIKHPIYGEALLSCHKDNSIKLWTI